MRKRKSLQRYRFTRLESWTDSDRSSRSVTTSPVRTSMAELSRPLSHATTRPAPIHAQPGRYNAGRWIGKESPMTDFVALKCPACGGRLEVFNDMTAFACGYCGNALTTRRRGGTISLSLEEAVESVAANTDRTAAELAMARLTKELEEAAGTVQYLEQHEKDVAWSFDQKDLMSEADAD